MPRLTVVWSLDVQADMTTRWVQGDSKTRSRITEIVDLVDRRLPETPSDLGTAIPSEPSLRIWIVPGLPYRATVTFEVLDSDRVVRVIGITIRD